MSGENFILCLARVAQEVNTPWGSFSEMGTWSASPDVEPPLRETVPLEAR